MRTILLISAGALALAGCDKLTNGQTPPARRAGLWVQTFVRDGKSQNLGAMRTVRVCIGADTDAGSPIFSYAAAIKQARDSHCTSPTASRSLDGSYRFSSTCPIPGGGSTFTKGSASGDFTSAYHLRIETRATGASFATLNGNHVTEIDGKLLGPCPAGMAPGDMQLANGMKLPGGRLVDPHRTAPSH